LTAYLQSLKALTSGSEEMRRSQKILSTGLSYTVAPLLVSIGSFRMPDQHYGGVIGEAYSVVVGTTNSKPQWVKKAPESDVRGTTI